MMNYGPCLSTESYCSYANTPKRLKPQSDRIQKGPDNSGPF